MDSNQLKEIYSTYFYYILIGGIIFGLLMGAIPLILGMRRKKQTLGVVSLVVCGICGAFSPLLSIILAVIFTIIIIKTSGQAEKSPDISDLQE